MSSFSLYAIRVETSSIDGYHLVNSCAPLFNNVSIGTLPIVDTDATGFSFVDKTFLAVNFFRVDY